MAPRRDIDLDRGRLHVVGIAVKEPKTARSRRAVTLPSFAVEALRKHRAEQAETRLTLGLGKDDDMLALGDPLGNATRPSNLIKPFNRIVAKAGVPRISFHGLRHSHATLLLKAGTNPKIVSERLGHSGVSITLDTYSHVLPGMQENVAAAVEAALRASPGNA
jgi:integrase